MQGDQLAVFSANGAKRLKTPTTTLADLATSEELFTKRNGNIVGNSSSGTAI